MAAPFAALETRLNTAVFKHLSNKDATLNSVAVAGIFEAPGAPGSVGELGMAGVQPVYTLPSASVPANPVGLALVLGAVNYVVAAHEPDGTGLSRLILERAA